MRILWVTNDLPPRPGGIEQFVASLIERVHPETTLVLGPPAGAEGVSYDRAQPYSTVRSSRPVMPTPAVRRAVIDLGRLHRPDVVVLGAAWPLGHLARSVSRALNVPAVALSHGLEAGMARTGGGRLIALASHDLAAMTTIAGWTEDRLRPHVRAQKFARLAPGVDTGRFHPEVEGLGQRRAWGVPDDAPLVGCISRLVPRKGQDQLLRVWPHVRELHPDAYLALVGEGPAAKQLRSKAAALGPDAQVVLPGQVRWGDLPASFAALDLFAMPCRSRYGGLDIEGLGIVYLEAQASGVPVIAGDSGGAPEALQDGVTGTVVGSDRALIDAIDGWLRDNEARKVAAKAGRAFAEAWSWDAVAAKFSGLLEAVVHDANRQH